MIIGDATVRYAVRRGRHHTGEIQGNHVIIVTSSFSKSSVSKMFSVHTKTKSQRF